MLQSEREKIYKDLAQGEDASARDALCHDLGQTIDQSNDGIIGIGDFVRDLEISLAEAKDYMANFKQD